MLNGDACTLFDSSISSRCFFCLRTKSLKDSLAFFGAASTGGAEDEAEGEGGDNGYIGHG
jgi:hypothetical protein